MIHSLYYYGLQFTSDDALPYLLRRPLGSPTFDVRRCHEPPEAKGKQAGTTVDHQPYPKYIVV